MKARTRVKTLIAATTNKLWESKNFLHNTTEQRYQLRRKSAKELYTPINDVTSAATN